MTIKQLGGVDLEPLLARIDHLALPAGQREELRRWVHYLRLNLGRSAATLFNYLRSVAGFLAWLAGEGVPLAQVEREHVERWQRALFVDGRRGASTRALHLHGVRGFLRWRALQGLAAGNPAAEVPAPRIPKRTPRKFTTDQLRALLASCDRRTPRGVRDYALLLFFYGTGARRGEVERLDLDQLEIGERRGLVHFLGKGSKERVVRLNRTVLGALQAWLAVRETLPVQDPGAVWLTTEGCRAGWRMGRSALRSMLQRAAKAAGLRPGVAYLHRLRATFATELYDAGVDLEIIRAALGHEDLETTRRYIAISDRALQVSIPEARLREVTGENVRSMPLWYRRKLPQQPPEPPGLPDGGALD